MATIEIDRVDIANLIVKKNESFISWLRPYADGSVRVDYDVAVKAEIAMKQLEDENIQLRDWILERAKSGEERKS